MTAEHFSDPASVAQYGENARRMVPGLTLVHELADALLSEAVPEQSRVLVVGAGGGLELAHLAEHHAGWTFDGVDPSAEMLRLAVSTLGPHADRVALHEGYVDDAPEGPFDAAVCLLTLHFLDAEERGRTLREIRRRLHPGAPLVTFHHSVPAGDVRTTWLQRWARFTAAPGTDDERIASTVATMATRLPILSPEEDEALLRDAGFRDVGVFYGALTFRGWVGTA
ncbi:class I SAM-dependent methyltransferase [Patulibacter americanus]|uniref:class I SAM-dependent methyltransferase n=1 Tax=Patulibacter americanus TaxID=588672 RepID=UPI0003B4FBA6|nr:class I SAM-dependent methyltransferase [Patulibacter americanus]